MRRLSSATRHARAHWALICVAACVLFTAGGPASAQTNLRAWHANGQTFLVWEHSGPVTAVDTYDVYRSTAPMAALSDGAWVGRVFADDGSNYRIQDFRPGARWVLPDASGGSYEVGANEDYFALTPHLAETAYYAVVLTGSTSLGPSNTSGPVSETMAAATCHIQFMSAAVAIYGHWIDGSADPDSGRPGYPILGNEWSNGIGFNFAVWRPFAGLPPGDVPLVVYIHGGYGNVVELSSAAAFLVPDGLLATLDDPLKTYNGLSGTAVDQNTFWCGYQKALNRFSPTLPTGAQVVIDYTARRLWWEVGWMAENLPVQAARVSLCGPSMGGLGTMLHLDLRPELFAAGLAYVPLLAGPRGMLDPQRVWYIFGTAGQNLPSSFDGSPGIYDILDQRWRASQPHPDRPFAMLVSGKNDTHVQWPDNLDGYVQLDAGKTGAWLYWDERGHMADEWKGAHFERSQHARPGFLTRFRSDQSFPAFSATDTAPAVAGRQPDTGTGDPASGDPWGTWGGYLEWDPQSILDETGQWSVRFWVVHVSSDPNDIPASDTVLASVTPRRLQRFAPQAGRDYNWALFRDSTGETLQQSVQQAAPDGTITIPDLFLRKEETTLRIWDPSPPEVYLLRDDSIRSLDPATYDLSALLPLRYPADLYIASVRTGFLDPDPAVPDAARPLIFYGLSDQSAILRLVGDGAHIVFHF